MTAKSQVHGTVLSMPGYIQLLISMTALFTSSHSAAMGKRLLCKCLIDVNAWVSGRQIAWSQYTYLGSIKS